MINKIVDRIYQKLLSIKPWNFIWMAVLASELFTLLLNVLLAEFLWGEQSLDLIVIGAIDSFIVSLIVGSLIIYFVNRMRHDRLVNEELRKEVTNRKQAEMELLKAKTYWEDTFNTINDAITIHDDDFNIILSNKAAEDLLGQSMDRILSQKCYESYHGSTCPPEGCPSCLTLNSGKASTTELYEPNLKKHIEIKAMPRFGDNGSTIGIVHVVRDISERKKAEEELTRANQMTLDILEKSPYGIYMVNRKGTIEYVNTAMESISGIKYENFVEKINVFTLPTYKELGLSEKIFAAINGDNFFLGPVHYTSNYSNKKTIRNFTGMPIEENGEDKALIFVEDVTDREQAKAAQQKLREQLIQAQKMESIGRLAGGVAHDFNNILSVIIGYSDLIMNKLPEDGPAREELQIISEAGRKASNLTGQLLAFSRKQVLEMKVTNLNNIVKDISKMLHRMIGEDINLVLQISRRSSNVLADPGQIEQVLMNLAINARDAMPQGGTLTIEIADEYLDEQFVLGHEGAKKGSYVRLSLHDSGSGILPEEQKMIFEPFYTTKEVGKGTGLGLATVYGIVKQHNGYIYVKSNINEGTTFDVYLPVVMSLGKDTAEEKQLSIEKRAETILVVEDEPSIRQLIYTILTPLGYNVLEAGNGKEALKVSESHAGDIDVVLTDVIMPEMNGHELAKRLQSSRPSAKVIFMSGYTDDVIAKHGVLEPGVAFVQKPISTRSIVEKIQECLAVN
ncbi:MAG: response regulator [Desulfobulbales bacterium]|nr:response regulator [Desulfobulbales bacterium]